VPECRHNGSRFFKAQEEKRTDVNIAVHMLADAFNDSCERFVLVSGDSDLVPAIKQLKKNRPGREVIVYIPANDPTRGAAVEIRSAADKNKTLPNILLQKAQFPAKLRSTENDWIEKPASW
jgi:6-hydroxy-3-succinoylpyridine 3-monooxygenase